MSKITKYKWGEFEVNVTEVPVFDTKSNKFVCSLASAKVEEIDFEALTNEIIKRGDNVQIPFVINFNNKWFNKE